MASETDLSLPPPHLILPDPVVPATDYDNYQFAFKETPEFLAEVKDRLTKNARPYVRQEPYGHKYAMATVEDQVTDAALRFLRNIDPDLTLQLVEDQELQIYAKDKMVGTYAIKMKRLPSVGPAAVFHILTIYHAQIGETESTKKCEALISGHLVTLAEKIAESHATSFGYYEYNWYVERRENGNYLVNSVHTDNKEVTTWYNEYPKNCVEGFIGECASVFLNRLLSCNEVLPENFAVLGLTSEGRFQKVTYNHPLMEMDHKRGIQIKLYRIEMPAETFSKTHLPSKMLVFRPYRVECFGFTRQSPESERNYVSAEEYYLNRRLVYRRIQGTDTIIRSDKIPDFRISTFVQPLEQQETARPSMDDAYFMNIRSTERRELFERKYANIVSKMPQLTEPLREMVHLILTFRPRDIFAFVSHSFKNWANMFKDRKESNKTSTLPSIEEKRPFPTAENDFCRLLRTYGI